MTIHIRRETQEDYYTVEALTREAFWETLWGIDGQVIPCNLRHFLAQ